MSEAWEQGEGARHERGGPKPGSEPGLGPGGTDVHTYVVHIMY